MNKIKLKNFIIGLLALNFLLFFIPWFSMNMEAKVFDYDTFISGFKLSGYASNLQGLAKALGDGIKSNLANLVLIALKHIIIMPILSVVSIITIVYNIRIRRFLLVLTFSVYIIVPILVFIIPLLSRDLFDIMNSIFVVTPSLYIMFFSSVLGLLSSKVSFNS